MLKLYQFDPKFGLPNISPFCMKVETYLRMARIQYTNMYITDPRKAPNAKLPYIDDDGHIVADSAFILEYLKEKHSVEIDRDLNTHKLGISRMITGAVEERLYFAMVYNRWIDQDNWPMIRETWFGGLPPVIRSIIPAMVQKSVKKTLHGHGIGRHTPAQIYEIGVQDLQGIVDVLGDQKYMLGSSPHSVDAAVFPVIANFLHAPASGPLQDFVQDQTVLKDYSTRMGKRYFHEYKIFAQ